MPQMGQMPSGSPSQMGIGALAAQRQQGGQADPRLMAMMQALGGVPQGGIPPGAGTAGPMLQPMGGGMMPQGGPGMIKPDPQALAAMQAFQQQGGQGSMPMPKMPGIIDDFGMPGGIPVQRPMPFDPRRPMPVGAGGKGTGMPPPGMVNPPRPMPLPPGLNRPMPMPMPPGVNRPMPMPKPAPQPARPTPKPVNPRFNQIMPFLR